MVKILNFQPVAVNWAVISSVVRNIFPTITKCEYLTHSTLNMLLMNASVGLQLCIFQPTLSVIV